MAVPLDDGGCEIKKRHCDYYHQQQQAADCIPGTEWGWLIAKWNVGGWWKQVVPEVFE
jgi:hypothetical protein